MPSKSKPASQSRVATELTGGARVRYVKFMRRNGFWLCIVLVPGLLQAQPVPGRDLLDFPIGSFAEGPAVSITTRDGLRNPAAVLLPDRARARFSVSSLTTSTEQGVAGRIASLAFAAPREFTAALTIVRADVVDIVHTENDPSSVGEDVQYNTLVVSGAAAWRPAPNVTTGLALRYHTGQVDVTRSSVLGIDAGILIENLWRVDGRLGLSSFLWRPGAVSGDGASFAGAFDARIAGPDSLRELRGAYSYSHAPGLTREHFLSASGRLGHWEARAGVARSMQSTRSSTRARLGVGLHYRDYVVGVAREDTPQGLSPVYHFTFVVLLGSR